MPRRIPASMTCAQINDSVRYAPSSARYKVYIIDEVHMLSTAAFNAFLKTLEEPPEHAKFVFATTEIRKVPVTVLSRCQRFDLRRVDADVLMQHLGRHRREGKRRAPNPRRSASSPARPRARCAIRCRCSIRRSRMRPARACRRRAADARPRRPHARDRTVRISGARRHRGRLHANSATSTIPAPTRWWC